MMDYTTRLGHAQGLYAQGLAKDKNNPEPIGQKFPCGTRVRIAEDLGKTMAHFKSGVEATVEYTYDHAYGGGNVKSYSLMFDDGNTSAWYKEWQLTAV